MKHDSNTPEHAPLRDERGRLLPGHSLNPAGRPKGATPSEAKKLHGLIEAHREALVTHLAEVAKGTDSAAVKASEILLGYLAARPRPTAELVYVPGIADGATLEEKCEAVLSAVANGEVTSTAAFELLGVIHRISEIVHLPRIKAKLREAKGEAPKRITAESEPDDDGSDLL